MSANTLIFFTTTYLLINHSAMPQQIASVCSRHGFHIHAARIFMLFYQITVNISLLAVTFIIRFINTIPEFFVCNNQVKCYHFVVIVNHRRKALIKVISNIVYIMRITAASYRNHSNRICVSCSSRI